MDERGPRLLLLDMVEVVSMLARSHSLRPTGASQPHPRRHVVATGTSGSKHMGASRRLETTARKRSSMHAAPGRWSGPCFGPRFCLRVKSMSHSTMSSLARSSQPYQGLPAASKSIASTAELAMPAALAAGPMRSAAARPMQDGAPVAAVCPALVVKPVAGAVAMVCPAQAVELVSRAAARLPTDLQEPSDEVGLAGLLPASSMAR
mmetsp:Transcript_70305/g.194482  ORF Transcript_70305/g.194482 Transcript_70305/m.194482 type:complete len:206 (-) Transcript_70305:75-692(-)